MRASWVIGWLLVGAFGAGCGDDSGGASVIDGPNLSRDEDGGSEPMTGDGDGDGPEPRPPRDLPPGIVGGCGLVEDEIFELAQTSAVPHGLPLGMNRIKSRAGFIYIDEVAGCTEGLYVADIDGPAAQIDPPESLLAIEHCARFADPAITWSADEAWLMAFVDNRVGNEVWAQVFDPVGDLSNEGFQISLDARQPGNVAVAVVDDRRMIAWAEGGLPNQPTTVYARPVDATGEPLGPQQTVATFPEAVGSLSLAQLGKRADTHPEPGALLALWRRGAESVISVYALDLDGKPKGGERVVRRDVGDQANVAVTYNDRHKLGDDLSSAAIAYTVSVDGGRQMWFEILDGDGNLGPLWSGTGQARGDSSPVRIINSPQRAANVSIARYAQGYIVVFRAPPGGDVTEPTIRAVFLNETGGYILDTDIAHTTEFGGPTGVVVGSDGRIVVAWTEFDDVGTATYKVARLPCP